MHYLYEIPMLIIVVGVAKYHADHYDNNIPISGWWHFLWGLPFAGLVGVLFLITRDYWLVAALIFERFLFFNPTLNFMRKKLKLPSHWDTFFYLHGEAVNGSFVDTFLENIVGKLYPALWFISLAFFIYLQFKL